MAVTLNKANLVLKDANGNIGKIEQLSNRDLAKIKTAVSDVALVVNQSNHKPIVATTTNKGVVQLATSSDLSSGAIDKVVTAEQLHNATAGISAIATKNLARIDAVVTAAGISVDHTNTNQLKTAVTTLISKATPAKATASTLGVVKPDNDTIKIDSNGVLTATAQKPGVATTSTVGVVKPDGSTITINSNGVLTATAKMPGVATTTKVGVVKPDGNTITVDGDGTLTCNRAILPITGEIKWFAFKQVPTGYLFCNGASVSRTTYANLFAVIGTTFGKGDGSTTFNLPDLRDRYIIGAHTNALGTKIAEQLPNIIGDVMFGHSRVTEASNAFSISTLTKEFGFGPNVETGHTRFNFNAHGSNSIYTNNGHVYPLSLALLPCIKY